MQCRFLIDDILLCSGDIRDPVAKMCKIAHKFLCFWPPNYGGKGSPKCLTEFHKSGSPSNMCQSLVTTGQATSEIRRRKKKDLNYSGKNRMLSGQHSWQTAIKNFPGRGQSPYPDHSLAHWAPRLTCLWQLTCQLNTCFCRI